jgi:glucosyl-3-phosphoglycerate synthase
MGPMTGKSDRQTPNPKRNPMSDFFQHGLISTLHQFNDQPRLGLSGAGANLALVLPCHHRDLGSNALSTIIAALNNSSLFDLIVVTMNGIRNADTTTVARFWSQLRVPHRVLWNDEPSVQQWLSGKGFSSMSGKGLNLWMAVGFISRHTDVGAFVIHDCDIKNYAAGLPASLADPVVMLGYRFCKGFYPRVQEQLYGRVTRLFVIPLIRSFVRVIGHFPLLDFIDSFRYPLAGECALTTDLAVHLPIETGWSLEIGLLAEVHRLIEPREVCQVDLAIRYDHKHQTLDPQQPSAGLLGMVGEIALSVLSHLEREGCHFDSAILDSVCEAYQQAAADFVRRYRDVAIFNRIPFAESQEKEITERFHARLKEITGEFAKGTRALPLPPWTQVAELTEVPDFPVLKAD